MFIVYAMIFYAMVFFLTNSIIDRKEETQNSSQIHINLANFTSCMQKWGLQINMPQTKRYDNIK